MSIVTSGFEYMAKAVASTLIDRPLHIVVYPGMVLHDSPDTLNDKVANVLAEPIVEGLLSR